MAFSVKLIFMQNLYIKSKFHFEKDIKLSTQLMVSSAKCSLRF